MDSYLPQISGMNKNIRKGRNVYEGYQRGWGLQYSDLREKVLNDPLYHEALKLAECRTIVAELRRMNIFLILKYFLPRIERGHIIEFGSYLGGNAIFMAIVADKIIPGTKVYGLDSYEGLPITDKNVDAHNKGDFADVNLDELFSYVDKIGVKNLDLCKGYFEDTASLILKEAKKISLAHIDCDILSSVQYSYEVVKPYMVDGGYIVFDDATDSSCMGATEVVEDQLIRRDGLNSEQIFPHYVFRSWRRG
jgi:hypothetical protein